MSPSWWPWGRYSGQCKCKCECKQLYTRILYTLTSRNFGTACLPRTQLNSWGFALSRTEAWALSKRLALPKAGLHQWLQVLRRPAGMRRRHYAASVAAGPAQACMHAQAALRYSDNTACPPTLQHAAMVELVELLRHGAMAPGHD